MAKVYKLKTLVTGVRDKPNKKFTQIKSSAISANADHFANKEKIHYHDELSGAPPTLMKLGDVIQYGFRILAKEPTALTDGGTTTYLREIVGFELAMAPEGEPDAPLSAYGAFFKYGHIVGDNNNKFRLAHIKEDEPDLTYNDDYPTAMYYDPAEENGDYTYEEPPEYQEETNQETDSGTEPEPEPDYEGVDCDGYIGTSG